ncbi:MAG: MtrB/PioB family outer membrane beta-barrel protein [Silanimonas sp.]
MQRSTLVLAIAAAALAVTGVAEARDARSKAGHRFKGSVELQYRSNDNIAIAPSSGERFDFARLAEFAVDDENEGTDESWDEEDGFDDLVDLEPSEDEIEVDDAVDEDGDGIDDLIDPDADSRIDEERRFAARFALGHRYTFASGRTTWTNGLRFASETHGQRDDLDKFNWAATTGFGFASRGARHVFRPSLSYVVIDRKDAGKFSSTVVVSMGYTYRASRRLRLGATYNYQDKDITSPTAPDARIDTLSFDADFVVTTDDVVKLEFSPKVEDSTEFTRNSDAWGWEAAYTRRLPWDMTAGVGYRFHSVDYVNLQPNRKDDHRAWALQVSRRFGRVVVVELGYESGERESNQPGKDASNDSVYASGTLTF